MANPWDRVFRRSRQHGKLPLSRATEVFAAEEEYTTRFYGRDVTFQRGLLAMKPGEEPPMVTGVSSITMQCLAPVLKPGHTQLEPCGQHIQMYSNFRPVAYICPWCYSIYVFPAPGRKPAGSDEEFHLKAEGAVFCYGAYPGHDAQQSLAETIRQETGGNGLLAAHRFNPAGLTLSGSQVLALEADVPESDLRQMEYTPGAIVQNILQRGTAYYLQGEFWMAVALGERAAVVDPEAAMAYILIADALDELGHLQPAYDNYRKGVALDPNYAMGHNNLGAFLMKMHDFEGAEASYRRALALQPGMPEASGGLGQLLVMVDEYDEALPLLELAVRAQPGRLESTYMLAVAHFNVGQLQKALARLEECERIAPPDGDVLHAKAEVYLKMGRRQEALPLLRRGASLGSQPAVNRLKQLDLY